MNKENVVLALSAMFLFVMGITVGGITMPATDVITVTKTEKEQVQNEAACSVMFEWYNNWPGQAFSIKADMMYEQFTEVCE